MLVAALLLLVSCAQAAPESGGDLAIVVKGAGNGYLNVETDPGADCAASARTSGGDRPLQDAPMHADSDGRASWTYSSLVTEKELEVSYTVTCKSGALRGQLTTSPAPIRPNASSRVIGTAPDITVGTARYGSLGITSTPGAKCAVDVRVASATFGEPPPARLDEKVIGADGAASWTYSATRAPAGRGEYQILCETSAGSRRLTTGFEISARTLRPTGITVHVSIAKPARETYREEPSLVPLRDSSVTRLVATLANEWKNATRNLGSLQVTDTSADITVFVVAAKGTSVHRRSTGDLSEDIVVYVSDEIGVRSVENTVAVTLHELGHIWCCTGSGTTDGHWTTAEASPGLSGVDKYGLMNHPVMCVVFGAITSCPNRFSDRELQTMGFTELPPPAADTCVVQKRGLLAQLASARTQLTSLQAAVNDVNQKIATLADRIRAIEAQYPNGIPPNTWDGYQALIRDHNALVVENRARVTTYNATVTQVNGLVGQINALPCEAS